MPPPRLTPQLLVAAYVQGYFPMARSRHGPVDWCSPDPRAILPLQPPQAFHVSRSLRRTLRRGRFRITFDQCFERVIRACAAPRPYADETWINDQIIRAYTRLHTMGLAHSVEAWGVSPGPSRTQVRLGSDQTPGRGAAPADEEKKAADAAGPEGGSANQGVGGWSLVGGIYGVSLGGAFFGESMFSRTSDASKVCLAHLVERLRQRGFALFDAQISNPHIAQVGVIDIARDEYLRRLEAALRLRVAW